jgi:hypothetical protein
MSGRKARRIAQSRLAPTEMIHSKATTSALRRSSPFVPVRDALGA